MVAELQSSYLDFWASFSIPAGKRASYQTMIGNTASLINPYATERCQANLARWTESTPGSGDFDKDDRTFTPLPARVLNIPLPFYFCATPEDSIINAATPYNDITVKCKVRALSDLLIVDALHQDKKGTSAYPKDWKAYPAELSKARIKEQTKLTLELHAHYVLIPNGDREKFVAEKRIDQIIEQNYYKTHRGWSSSTSSVYIDLHHPHTIRALYFGARNSNLRAEWSNYGTDNPHFQSGLGVLTLDLAGTEDTASPISTATLRYEGVQRFQHTSDYFTHVSPYYFASNIPQEVGMHLISYSVDLKETNRPMGATNFARLSSVTLELDASNRVKDYVDGLTGPDHVTPTTVLTTLVAADPAATPPTPEVAAVPLAKHGSFYDVSPAYEVNVVIAAQTLWRYPPSSALYQCGLPIPSPSPSFLLSPSRHLSGQPVAQAVCLICNRQSRTRRRAEEKSIISVRTHINVRLDLGWVFFYPIDGTTRQKWQGGVSLKNEHKK
jgi:hypothetical protein